MEHFTFAQVLITTFGGSACTWFVTWMLSKLKQKIDDAAFVTGEYNRLYQMIKDQNKELEVQNNKLESEIERSKSQEAICQSTLAGYGEKIKELESKLSHL